MAGLGKPQPYAPAWLSLLLVLVTGFGFLWEVIVLAVRRYLRFGLSYRDVEELLAERGVEVDPVTIYRWFSGSHRCSPRRPDHADARWVIGGTSTGPTSRSTQLAVRAPGGGPTRIDHRRLRLGEARQPPPRGRSSNARSCAACTTGVAPMNWINTLNRSIGGSILPPMYWPITAYDQPVTAASSRYVNSESLRRRAYRRRSWRSSLPRRHGLRCHRRRPQDLPGSLPLQHDHLRSRNHA